MVGQGSAVEGNPKHAFLALEDGTILYGKGFGAQKEVTGEVVFNTSMFGYPELLTDPSYYEQIVVMTYPIIGSYGVPRPSITDPYGVPLHFESGSAKVKGYVVHTLSRPSHWASDKPLEQWLEEQRVPGIMGLDTRAITQKLRTRGTMLGVLRVSEEQIPEEEITGRVKRLEDPNSQDLVSHVSPREPFDYPIPSRPDAPTVVLVDCGTKFGILRSLLSRGVRVVRVPYDSSAARILDYKPSGIVVSNGPGDPSKCVQTIKTTSQLLAADRPVLGICLGAQIIGIAAGAETFKLKFGHRAVNHPCIDLKTGRCYITTQNHGYSIKPGSLDGTGFVPSHLNANDKTVEGIRHKSRNILGIQWHPESSPGPYDTRFIFDKFVDDVRSYRN